MEMQLIRFVSDLSPLSALNSLSFYLSLSGWLPLKSDQFVDPFVLAVRRLPHTPCHSFQYAQGQRSFYSFRIRIVSAARPHSTLCAIRHTPYAMRWRCDTRANVSLSRLLLLLLLLLCILGVSSIAKTFRAHAFLCFL